MNHKSALIQQFTERGYMHQATNLEGLDETATQQIVPTYIGFDCTADSLHVGLAGASRCCASSRNADTSRSS